jgi:TetR/AcrR family transcriptional regulator
MSDFKSRPRVAGNRRGQSAETRAAILGAAEREFATAGLSGARTDVIAARAGVNKALLYYYFKSKEALYLAVLEDHLKEFNSKALTLLESAGPARKILLEYVELQFDFISERRRHAALFQQLLGAGGKSSERLIQKYIKPRSQALDRLLERGTREGQFRRTDRFHTAVSIVAMIVFYFSAAPVLRILGQADAYGAASLRRRKEQVLDFIRHALWVRPNESPSP